MYFILDDRVDKTNRYCTALSEKMRYIDISECIEWNKMQISYSDTIMKEIAERDDKLEKKSTWQETLDFLRSREKCNLLMVAINIAVFIVMEILGSTTDTLFMVKHGAMYVPLVLEYGEYYRLFTCMFLHFGVQHLLYNMLLLIFVGDMLEKIVGKVRYLLIYLAGGFAGNLLSMAVAMRSGDYAVSAGASGAIFAVLGALFCLVVRNRDHINPELGKRLVLMAVLSLVQGFTQAGTDNMAHLGGFLGGIVLCLIFCPKKSIRYQR